MSAALLRDRRALGGLAAIALAAVILVVFVLSGGSDSVAPATGAARLVPADALAYVHVSTDPHRSQTTRALTLLERFPSFAGLRAQAVSTLRRFGRGTGVDFERDIRPWLGDEAALGLLNTESDVATAVFVLDVRSKAKAREFLQRLGTPTASSYHGTTVDVYGDQATAFVSHYLVAGAPAGVRAAIDAHRSPDKSLARTPGYVRAVAGQPDDRVADAYASDAAITRVLAPRTGALGVVGTLLRQPGLEAVGLSLAARKDTFTLRVHSSLVGGATASTGGLPLRSFKATLAGEVPGPALGFTDLGGLGAALPRLLGAGSVGQALTGVAADLRRSGVDLERDVVKPLLSDEVAAALLPDPSAVPVLLVVAKTKDEAAAREAMAKLQPALTRLLGAAAGSGVPLTGFTERDVDGITAYQLRAGPTLELDYAVLDGEVAVATSLDAIAALHAGKHPLDDDAAFRATESPGGGDVTSLTFLDLSQLLDLAEETGLRNDPQYREVRDDLRTVRAVGLRTASGEAESTAEISLQIR